MASRILNYDIAEIKIDDNTFKVKLQMGNGECREAALMVARHTADNKLFLNIVPHFTDPDSVRWFNGTMPWKEDELQKVG